MDELILGNAAEASEEGVGEVDAEAEDHGAEDEAADGFGDELGIGIGFGAVFEESWDFAQEGLCRANGVEGGIGLIVPRKCGGLEDGRHQLSAPIDEPLNTMREYRLGVE